MEVVLPSVEGDQLVGAGDVSVPLEDILRLEVRKTDIVRSIGSIRSKALQKILRRLLSVYVRDQL